MASFYFGESGALLADAMGFTGFFPGNSSFSSSRSDSRASRGFYSEIAHFFGRAGSPASNNFRIHGFSRFRSAPTSRGKPELHYFEIQFHFSPHFFLCGLVFFREETPVCDLTL